MSTRFFTEAEQVKVVQFQSPKRFQDAFSLANERLNNYLDARYAEKQCRQFGRGKVSSQSKNGLLKASLDDLEGKTNACNFI